MYISKIANIFAQHFGDIRTNGIAVKCSLYKNNKHMKKLLFDFCREPSYFMDKLFGRSKISCSCHAYFTNNGRAIKMFYRLVELCGNRYAGN